MLQRRIYPSHITHAKSDFHSIKNLYSHALSTIVSSMSFLTRTRVHLHGRKNPQTPFLYFFSKPRYTRKHPSSPSSTTEYRLRHGMRIDDRRTGRGRQDQPRAIFALGQPLRGGCLWPFPPQIRWAVDSRYLDEYLPTHLFHNHQTSLWHSFTFYPSFNPVRGFYASPSRDTLP